jgi:hypothetical protein
MIRKRADMNLANIIKVKNRYFRLNLSENGVVFAKAHISTDFFTEFDVDDKICGYDATSAKSIFNALAGNKTKILRCVKDKLKYMVRTGVIYIGCTPNITFTPDTSIDKILVD